MKRFWLLSLLFLVAPQSFARSVEICPTLPADSGLEWKYSKGPDFDVCRAHVSASGDLAFGIYLGNHPDFHPKHAERVGKGKVADRRVIWYRFGPRERVPELSRQALLTLDRKWGYVAHIWVAAATEQQLVDRLSVLERIVFKV